MGKARYREVEAFTQIPIYEGRLLLVVSTHLERARAKRDEFFGGSNYSDLSNTPACLFRHNSKSRYGLFFEFGYIDHNTIAHEVFHFTCRLMDRNSVYLKSDNHEAHAIFHGWAVEWVYDRFRELGIRVKTKWR